MSGLRTHERPSEGDKSSSLNGYAKASPIDSLSPPSRRRPSYLVAGGLIIALAAMVGAWLYTASTSTLSIMVLARDVEAGEIVEAVDLRAVEVGSLPGARAVQPFQQDLIVGLAARGPLPEGTVVNTDLFSDRSMAVPSGMAVVGAELEPGAAPAGALVPGDRIVLLGVQSTSLANPDEIPTAVRLAQGSIWAIERPEATYNGRVVVSVLVPVEQQGVVAQAASDGRLRLSLVGEG